MTLDERERWLIDMCRKKAEIWAGTKWEILYRERERIHQFKLVKLERGEYVFTG